MKKGVMIIGVIVMIGLVSGCETKSKEEVEQSFDKVLAMYPTKNLMDFYDMEGYRDSEFDEDDKGVWSISSGMSISQAEEAPLLSEGMVLRINCNTKTSEGYYYIRSTPYDTKKEVTEERYPVIYDEQGFHLTKKISDAALEERIENFQFFVQYGEFKNLDRYENLRKMYNAEVPMYELEYQLTNSDLNVQQLRERYDIPIEDAPTLVLSGRGELDGSSVGYKRTTIQFTKNPPVFFSDSINYQPTKEEDNE
ncbi:tandem-type lipoprotein [Enterococcus sp. BWM-S5]|uniref:Tandem-type lipoprotein n=1 Tax=Enterococcus larvae TaxID=2794352 RepID=A0ABS4CMJ6_9ENTE|nr:tandem-type lipoprotein [Enterococcus larvae]MBP1047336.1 tandem-type lipoprotein [Enterococcus larvae]